MNGSIVDFRGPVQIQKVEIGNTIQRRTIHDQIGGVIFKAMDQTDLATNARSGSPMFAKRESVLVKTVAGGDNSPQLLNLTSRNSNRGQENQNRVWCCDFRVSGRG